MYASFEEKGKIFTNVVSKLPTEVIIQTQTHRIEGRVHIRPDDRLKDEIDQPEPFLPITDAVVYDLHGEALYRTTFMAVNRSQIIWIIPTEEIQSTYPGEK